MFKALIVGLPVMLLCLAIQASLTGVSLQYYSRHAPAGEVRMRMWVSIRLLMAIMLILMFGNLLQISIWAVLFFCLGEFTEFYEAVHHSAVNFTSLGYGDFVMSKPRKLLGPLEAANGVLMCGMTAGVLMAVLQAQLRNVVNRS